MFVRNITKYNDKSTFSKVRKILERGKGKLVPIAGQDCIYIYCDGVPIVEVNNKESNIFSEDYDKYYKLLEKKYMLDDICVIRKTKNKNDYIMDENYIHAFMQCAECSMPNDAERRSEQYIVKQHQSYVFDEYTICGMETTISGSDLIGTTRKGKQAEIDMVALCPAKKKIWLIEYKCGQGTLGNGVNNSLKNWNFDKESKNIVAHCKDFLAIMEVHKKIGFVKEIIKSFNLMSKIYGTDVEISMDDNTIAEYENNLGILFLLTNGPKEGAENKQKPLTKNSYKNLVSGEGYRYMPKCYKQYKDIVCRDFPDRCEEFVKNVDNIRYYAAVSPERVNLNDGRIVTLEELEFPV